MKKWNRRRGVFRYGSCMAALTACLIFLVSGMTALAARTGTVTTDGARVREEASTEARRICSLPLDTSVEVLEETSEGGSTWYKVSFTYEGEQMSGWLRSDLLSVSESEETEEGSEETEETEEEQAQEASAYTIQEPAEAYSGADALIETTVQAGDQSFTAYQAEEDTALYLVWAAKADGSSGWYWYDPAEGTFQQDMGQFGSQGLISALQKELSSLKESSAQKLSQRLYVIIGLGAFSGVLLIAVTVLALRRRSADYYDDYEEEEDDFEEFLTAARKKKNWEDQEEEDGEDYEEEPEEKPDLSLTANLPEIDMSAVEEVEETAREEDDEEEDGEGFDIEILDLDDLNL